MYILTTSKDPVKNIILYHFTDESGTVVTKKALDCACNFIKKVGQTEFKFDTADPRQKTILKKFGTDVAPTQESATDEVAAPTTEPAPVAKNLFTEASPAESESSFETTVVEANGSIKVFRTQE